MQKFFYVNDEFKRSGFRELVNNQLGIRSSTKGIIKK